MYRQLSLWELEVNEFGAGDVPGSMRCLVKRPSAFLCFAAAVPAIGVEGWVEGIVVLGIQMFLDDAQGFTEPLKVHDFPGPQEADGVSYIRGIHGQTQDVVVGGSGFLLCCDLVKTTVSGNLKKELFFVIQAVSCCDFIRTKTEKKKLKQAILHSSNVFSA